MKNSSKSGSSKIQSKRREIKKSNQQNDEPPVMELEPCVVTPTKSDMVVTEIPLTPQPAQQLGRNQKMWIDTMMVFADCAVQKSPDGIFDVLARNFQDTGGLNWWLWRIGKGELTEHLKGKDIVDAIRKLSFVLFKSLKLEINRSLPRF